MKHTTRREPYNPRRADVLADENINVLHSREEFLSNSNNKHQLIKLLAKHFRGDCHTVIEYEGDRYTQIVAPAFDVSCQKQDVIVVADNTDVLVLLLYFWSLEIGDII